MLKRFVDKKLSGKLIDEICQVIGSIRLQKGETEAETAAKAITEWIDQGLEEEEIIQKVKKLM